MNYVAVVVGQRVDGWDDDEYDLLASHLHQREGDEVSGKLSPCVRFGVDFYVAD